MCGYNHRQVLNIELVSSRRRNGCEVPRPRSQSETCAVQSKSWVNQSTFEYLFSSLLVVHAINIVNKQDLSLVVLHHHFLTLSSTHSTSSINVVDKQDSPRPLFRCHRRFLTLIATSSTNKTLPSPHCASILTTSMDLRSSLTSPTLLTMSNDFAGASFYFLFILFSDSVFFFPLSHMLG